MANDSHSPPHVLIEDADCTTALTTLSTLKLCYEHMFRELFETLSMQSVERLCCNINRGLVATRAAFSVLFLSTTPRPSILLGIPTRFL